MQSHLAQSLPSAWVSRFANLIAHGLVLDLACGGGRHSRLLAEMGHQVLAIDRDDSALLTLQTPASPAISTLCFDLEDEHAATHPDWPFTAGRFTGIVITNYLHRPLFDAIFTSLADGGVLIMETFAQGNGRFGKPSNPAFLLAQGELLEIVCGKPDLRVIAFEDGYIDKPKPAMVQRICVRKSGIEPEAAQVKLGSEIKL